MFFLSFFCISQCEARRPEGCDTWAFIEGTIFSNLLMYDKAIQKFSDAIDNDDTYKNAYIERAAVYFELGQIELALKGSCLQFCNSKLLLGVRH